MAGYSQTPLSKKLGIKEGHRVLLGHAPEGFLELLEPLPANVVIGSSLGVLPDLEILFVGERSLLDREFPLAVGRLLDTGMIWVAWPKKASKVVTDLTEDLIRQTGLDLGVVDVKVCAISEIWSGLKFVRRLKDRKSGGLSIR